MAWVLALGAFARLFRSFLPILQPRPAFDAAWARLLAFCRESLLASPRAPEIAHGAVHALLLSSVRSPGERKAEKLVAFLKNFLGLVRQDSHSRAAASEDATSNLDGPTASSQRLKAAPAVQRCS